MLLGVVFWAAPAHAQVIAPHLDAAYNDEFEKIIRANWDVGDRARLVEAEAKLIEKSGVTKADRIKGSLTKVRSRIGMFGSGGFLTKVGTLGAVTTSFNVGWQIGGWVNGWLGLEGDETDLTSAPGGSSGYNVCTSRPHLVIRWWQAGSLYGVDLPAGFYVSCAGSASGTNALRVQYTPNPTGSYNASWTPYYQAIKDEVGGSDVCGESVGFGLNDICVLRSDVDNVGRYVTTPLTSPASGAPPGSIPVVPSVEPSQADLLAAARAVAAEDPDFAGWIDNTLDPDNNPDPLAPYVIPAIEPGETADAYAQRLRDSGKLGTVTVVDGQEHDSRYAPGAALGATPAVGSTVEVGTQPDVQVRRNPEREGGDPPPTAPVTETGTCEPWKSPKIDLDKLKQVPGDVFPFAVLPWLVNGLGGWTHPGNAPAMTVPMPLGQSFTIDLAVMNPALGVIRQMITVIAAIASMWWLAFAVMGKQRQGGEGE